MSKKEILKNIEIVQNSIEQNELWLSTVKSAKPSEIVQKIQEVDYLKSILEKAKALEKLKS
jgi:hypothetical protein